jgi:integrative and conjugative element protein (TIGR02256 family)
MAAEIRKVVTKSTAAISIRRWSRETGAVTAVSVPVTTPAAIELGGWSVRIHPSVVEQLKSLRAENLPSETGGILLGLVDRTLRAIAVTSLMPAPSDSEAWPTSFIRGSAGLRAAVDRVTKRTLGNIVYVGEWHSHPDKCNACPSLLDLQAVALTSVHTQAESLATLMLIVADGEYSLVLKSPESTTEYHLTPVPL